MSWEMHDRKSLKCHRQHLKVFPCRYLKASGLIEMGSVNLVHVGLEIESECWEMN